MLDFRLLGDRVRTTLVSSQQRALTTVSGQSSTWPAQLSPLRTRLAPLRTPQGRLALWRSIFPLLGFTAAYLAAYIYGNGLPRPAPLWPPDAILLSALLLAPPRRWRLYVLLTLPIRMLPPLAPGVPLWLLVVNWLNDTFTILLAAGLVRRFAPRPLRFTTLQAMGIYLTCAVLVAPALSAFVGAAGLATLGIPYWHVWWTWFLGDALASLILTPTIVMWVTTGRAGLRPTSRRRGLEALVLSILLLFVGWLLVYSRLTLLVNDAVYYLPLPLLVWAAVRLGPRGIASALTAVTFFAIASVAGFWGIAVNGTMPREVLSLQLFLIAIAVPLLLLAAQIEERRQAVQKVQRQAEELDRIFEAVADGIAVYDQDGREIRTNTALQRLLRLDVAPAEYAQLTLQERMALFAARDEQGRLLTDTEGPLPRALAGEVMEGVNAMDLRSRTFDGRDLELNVSAAPLRDGIGELAGVVCVFRDQTERNQLVREREEARASELALRETKAQMDTFLGIASHELKTPLTSLKLSLQWSQRQLRKLTQSRNEAATAEDTGLQSAMEQMERTAHQMERMEALVNDLVDVSRIQAGKLELRPEQADLVVIVHEAVAAQREAEPERTIYLERLPDLSVPVYADAGRIEQVVTNFLTNALKYSPVDRPVKVGLQVEPEQTRVRVWVRDFGQGLPLSEQGHIWERFHRAQSVEVQSGTGVGLGLGLYISRMIVEHHQGQVGVQSAPGQGATFWFTLPLPASPES
jgi:signal transduction histidine kinase/integral membrane sensor domain MASE1